MTLQPYIQKNIAMAWPLALNGLLMQSMLMIDTFLVSPLGEIPLAAMGIATTIVAAIIGIQMALANGTQLVLSRAVGSGNNASLSKAFYAGLIINSAVATLFWLALTCFEWPLITLLTDSLPLQQQVADYLVFSKYLLLFTAVTQVITALFNGLSKTKVPLKGYLIELPINALLSYLLIHGFNSIEALSFTGMGVKGAAIGSLIAIAVRLVYLVCYLHVSTDINITRPMHGQAMRRNLQQHFVEISPIAANVTILSIGIAMYQFLYAQLDINAYVAITLVMPWIRAGMQFVAAWSHSSAITISQAIGSRKMHNLSRDVNASIDMAVIISFFCVILFAILSVFMADIYPELDASTYQALTIIAPLYIFLPIVRGYNTVHGNILRALGKTTAVFKINFIGQWIISIPLCAAIIFNFEGNIFWAFAIQPFEEIVKALPFRHLAKKSLAEFDADKAEKLMYD